MSSMSAAAPDPTQELGAEDEVTAFNNEEEGEYEGDESLNDIKDELQLEADSDKAKTSSGHPQATIVTAQAFPVNQPTFLVNSGLIQQRLPMLAPGSAQAVDPSRRVLPMAHVYSIQALQGLSTMPTVKMEVPASSASYHTSTPGVMYPGYPAGIPVVPTTPGVGYPYVLGSPYVPVQLQQNMLGPQGSMVPGMVPGNPPQPPPEKKKPHVKKPLNAFMLFMREKRADVMKECSLKESAAINQILGKMWHALSKEEQEKYYDMARHERAKHMQMYPGWSARDNYAIHKKRKKRKPAKEAEECSTADMDPNAKKCRARHGMEQQALWCQPCRKKKCERYGEEDDDDEDCACEHVKKEKIETFKSDHIGDQSLGGTSQEGSHQIAGDSNHTGVNGSTDGTLTSKDTMQELVSLAT